MSTIEAKLNVREEETVIIDISHDLPRKTIREAVRLMDEAVGRGHKYCWDNICGCLGGQLYKNGVGYDLRIFGGLSNLAHQAIVVIGPHACNDWPATRAYIVNKCGL